jgi:NADH:ubiquinone oxidoreductase subunit F (NADH-binding)/NADH:ubiquinone oxidoreductase subunit E
MTERMSFLSQPIATGGAPHDTGFGQADDPSRADVQQVIGASPAPELLVDYLHLLQDRWGGLHPQHLAALAEALGLAPQRLAEVLRTNPALSVLPPGAAPAALTVHVCHGLSCGLAGSAALEAGLPTLLGPDVRVSGAPCVGRCGDAPAVLVGQVAVPQATTEQVLNIVLQEAEREPGEMGLAHGPDDFIGYDAYRAQGGYSLAAAIVNGEEPADTVLEALAQAGLREPAGISGESVLAAAQWQAVREAPAPRLLVLHVASAETGGSVDRDRLERDPHRVLEGLLIAAQVVGTEAVVIALRDEFHDARTLLQAELAALQAHPPCPLPHIVLRRLAGGYVAGENTALFEALQGRPALPRARPPDPLLQGLHGRPTLVTGVSTLHRLRELVESGAQGFLAQGRHGHHGLRSFNVSGRVRRPGVKEAPAGITLHELIEEHCGGMLEGHELYAWVAGGGAGGILPARLGNVPLDHDTLQRYGANLGGGEIVVLGHHDRARDAAAAMMRWLASESCGQCTACRLGTARAAELMNAPHWDLRQLDDLHHMVVDTARCGLGRNAPNALQCVQRYFAHELG